MAPESWQYFGSLAMGFDGSNRRKTSKLMVCENCQKAVNESLRGKHPVRRIKNEVSTLSEEPEGFGDLSESVADREASYGVSDDG